MLPSLNFKVFFLFFLFPLFIQSTHGQEVLEYEISVAGFTIGNLETSKNSKGDSVFYKLKSKVNFWFFGKVNVAVENQASYFKNQFVESIVDTNTNKGDFQSTVIWDDGKYEVDASTYKYELKTALKGPIYFSSSRLHFEEPVGQSTFLAENYGLISPIKKKDDHYEVNVNGNQNKYFYIDGVLDKAIMENPIKNYVIKRIY